jgi:DNA-binding transcriptional LysR family regulator
MELRTLRVFVEVVRQGGFSRAAKTVFATQSTVSKAVKQLEDEIGVPLLDRIGHRSKLTAAGEIVYQRAQRILAERDDLMSELDEVRGLKRGLLRLGLPLLVSSRCSRRCWQYIGSATLVLRFDSLKMVSTAWRKFWPPVILILLLQSSPSQKDSNGKA